MRLKLFSSRFVRGKALKLQRNFNRNFYFFQSINEQNFRYTGARLCHLLDSLDLSPQSTFRGLLVMKMEFQNTEQVPFMQNDQRRVRGTTLFLAELFVQLKRPEVSEKIISCLHQI